MSDITTHVLDVSKAGLQRACLSSWKFKRRLTGKNSSRGATDSDGRLRHLLAPGSLVKGTYRLEHSKQKPISNRARSMGFIR